MYKKPSALNIIIAALATLLITAVTGCGERPSPVKGFYLPEGDIERGKQVFIDYQCYECHSIPEIDFPEGTGGHDLDIELGGKVIAVEDYGQLLTSVIKPDHIISQKYLSTLAKEDREGAQSPMPNFNDALTVSEMIDLVTFLHSRYEETLPAYQGYYYP